MTPSPFRGTRAAINTTVSLIIDVTEAAANANQCMFRGQKALSGGVTLSMLDGSLTFCALGKGWQSTGKGMLGSYANQRLAIDDLQQGLLFVPTVAAPA
jgi:hypothetical protein